MRKETDLKMRIYVICALISVAKAGIASNEGLRQRRDVPEIQSAQEYLPPVETYTSTDNVAETQLIEETNSPTNIIELGSDGYQYKTVRRLKYRERRDVNELANEYLPPAETNIASEYISPAEEASYQHAEELVAPENSELLRANDGQSPTDVPQDNDFLRVDNGQSDVEAKAAPEYIPPDVSQDNAVLRVDNGQSDAEVNAAPEYIPPDVSQDNARLRVDNGQSDAEVNTAPEYIPPDVTQNFAISNAHDDDLLREVNAASQYIPPAEEAAPKDGVAIALKTTEQFNEPQNTAVLGEDGYQYKTVRRLKYRQRRNVAELASDYLPPTTTNSEEVIDKVVEKSALTESNAQEPNFLHDNTILNENGYQYKTVRRLKYRQRRDIAEITPEYLPPNDVTENDSTVVEVPESSAVLAKDGYRYRTIKRLRF